MELEFGGKKGGKGGEIQIEEAGKYNNVCPMLSSL